QDGRDHAGVVGQVAGDVDVVADLMGQDRQRETFKAAAADGFQVDHHRLIDQANGGDLAAHLLLFGVLIGLEEDGFAQHRVSRPPRQGLRPNGTPLFLQRRHGSGHVGLRSSVRMRTRKLSATVKATRSSAATLDVFAPLTTFLPLLAIGKSTEESGRHTQPNTSASMRYWASPERTQKRWRLRRSPGSS